MLACTTVTTLAKATHLGLRHFCFSHVHLRACFFIAFRQPGHFGVLSAFTQVRVRQPSHSLQGLSRPVARCGWALLAFGAALAAQLVGRSDW